LVCPRYADQDALLLVATAIAAQIEEFQLAAVLPATAEHTEATDHNVRVRREADGLHTVAGIAPSAAKVIEPADHLELAGLRFRRLLGLLEQRLLEASRDVVLRRREDVQAGEQIQGGLRARHAGVHSIRQG